MQGFDDIIEIQKCLYVCRYAYVSFTYTPARTEPWKSMSKFICIANDHIQFLKGLEGHYFNLPVRQFNLFQTSDLS